MQFVRFLNNRQQEIFVRQREDQYSASADGEVHAAVALLWGYRTFFRLLFIPKVLVHYFLVCVGIAREPRAAMDDQAAADKRMVDKVAKDLKVKGAGANAACGRRLDS